RVSGRLDAYTSRAETGRVAPWRIAGPRKKEAVDDRLSPKLRTKGMPTWPALRAHRGYRDVSNYDCGPRVGWQAAEASRNRLSTTHRRRSDKTACSKEGPLRLAE